VAEKARGRPSRVRRKSLDLINRAKAMHRPDRARAGGDGATSRSPKRALKHHPPSFDLLRAEHGNFGFDHAQPVKEINFFWHI
jgi:hypothetical protein